MTLSSNIWNIEKNESFEFLRPLQQQQQQQK